MSTANTNINTKCHTMQYQKLGVKMILFIPVCYSMCDLIKVSSIFTIAQCWLSVDERLYDIILYAAPILCGARRDLALESVRKPMNTRG
jgi:hypothetical protein